MNGSDGIGTTERYPNSRFGHTFLAWLVLLLYSDREAGDAAIPAKFARNMVARILIQTAKQRGSYV